MKTFSSTISLSIFASSTNSIFDLKILANSDCWAIRQNVYFNRNSTEEIQLMVKSYERFGHLTK